MANMLFSAIVVALAVSEGSSVAAGGLAASLCPSLRPESNFALFLWSEHAGGRTGAHVLVLRGGGSEDEKIHTEGASNGSVLDVLEGFGDQANTPPWAGAMMQLIQKMQQNHTALQQNHAALQQEVNELGIKLRVQALRLRFSDEGHAPRLDCFGFLGSPGLWGLGYTGHKRHICAWWAVRT